MDLIDYRYGTHPTIIVSQVPVKDWHSLIGEDTIADAILDRIIHKATTTSCTSTHQNNYF